MVGGIDLWLEIVEPDRAIELVIGPDLITEFVAGIDLVIELAGGPFFVVDAFVIELVGKLDFVMEE